ncbi:TNF receptor-associated factor 1 [Strongylocentrotus purpuratus]|uniref:MATH domain-containing protein n=1 Tax=Strongylocentrotus purpuratus TaxID=7668 RepID=A0A7M7PQX0_STRPU|nr:TNF receptor-associated factor 1 [Strongylocentrotus purpuratus]
MGDDFETWDWTCGLVLRSDKPSVRNLILRLVLVFSALDPKVPITLENDEYAANQTSESGCPSDSISMDSNQFETRSGESNEVRPRQNGSSGRSSPDDQPDGQSLGRQLSSAILSPGASAAKGASNGYFPRFQDDDLESSEEKELRGAASEKDRDREFKKVKKDIEGLSERLEEMKDMPKAFASIYYKQELFQGVLATFNKDVMAVHTRLDKLNLSPNFRDPGIYDKLQKKFQELERSVASLRQYGEKIDERLLTLETSYSGVFVWKIANYTEKKRDAMNTNVKSIYSPPFYTSQYGYKLCGRVFLMGDGVGKGTHISLFLTIMKGSFDAVLPWPFKERITFQLVNQDDPINKSIVEAFRPDPASSSFKKPTTEKNIGAGCPLFAKIQIIEDPKSGFVRDNTVYLKIISQTSDVPDIK